VGCRQRSPRHRPGSPAWPAGTQKGHRV